MHEDSVIVPQPCAIGITERELILSLLKINEIVSNEHNSNNVVANLVAQELLDKFVFDNENNLIFKRP